MESMPSSWKMRQLPRKLMHCQTVEKGIMELELIFYLVIDCVHLIFQSKNTKVFCQKKIICINHSLLTFSNAFSGSEANVFYFFQRVFYVIFGAYILVFQMNEAMISADCILGLYFPFQNYPPKCCLVRSYLWRLRFQGSTFPQDQFENYTYSLTPEMSFIYFLSDSALATSKNPQKVLISFMASSLPDVVYEVESVYVLGVCQKLKFMFGQESLIKLRLNSSSLLNFQRLYGDYWPVYF